MKQCRVLYCLLNFKDRVRATEVKFDTSFAPACESYWNLENKYPGGISFVENTPWPFWESSLIVFIFLASSVKWLKPFNHNRISLFWLFLSFLLLQENIISLRNLLRLIESLIDEDDCEKLLKYFKVPADKAKTIKNSDEPSSSLFQHLTETDKLPPGDISLLLKACHEKGIFKVIEVWNNYQHFLSCKCVL